MTRGHTGTLDEARPPARTRSCVQRAMVEGTRCFAFRSPGAAGSDCESRDIGDARCKRRPPVYDSPTTRGLFDPTTGLYWSVDTFATPLPELHAGIADLDTEFWDFGLALFARGAGSPWLSLVDPKKYGKYVDRVQGLDITTVAGCHTPVIEGPFIGRLSPAS